MEEAEAGSPSFGAGLPGREELWNLPGDALSRASSISNLFIIGCPPY